MTNSAPSIAPYYLRDLADGIQQQMFFWGQDVQRPGGNFFVEQGFTRSPSTGLKGTHCYRREWQQGHIELYGSCAGWYGEGGGFTFMRPWHRCVIWRSEETTPIPGSWQKSLIERSATRSDLYQASLPFLDWLISHEYAVLAKFGKAYRLENYKDYRKRSKTKTWLPPTEALRWLQCYRERPEQLVRPKKLIQTAHG